MLDLECAQHHYERALHIARQLRSTFATRSMSAMLALIAVDRGDLALAETVLCSHLPPIDTLSTSICQRNVWTAQAALLLAHSEPAPAVNLLDQIIAATPNMTVEQIHPLIARLRASALRALGSAHEAEAQLRAGSRCAEAYGHLPQLWRTRLDLGRLYLEQRRNAEAGRELAVARALVEQLASEAPEGELRATFLRRATAMFPSRQIVSSLSPGETEVLRLVVDGLSDREIADVLTISHRTVTTHVTSIFNKLGVNTRTAAASHAIRHGLV
jgi:DNA-binding NarL/FixJ family response regulator